MENDTLKNYPAFEPMGLGLLASEMGKAVTAIYPDYNCDFTLGGGYVEQATQTFVWTGVHWTPEYIFARFSLIGVALTLPFIAALFFDRFDPSRTKPRRVQIKNSASTSSSVPVSISQALPTTHLMPLNKATNRFHFVAVLIAELKLMLKGQRWWWYAVAAGVIITCAVAPSATTREVVLPIAWVWPILIWSAIGNREIHSNVQQLVFSSASPVWRQLPAQWLAGFIVTLLMASGATFRFMIEGDVVGLLALLSGAVFIPSLSLATGVWSGTSKLFEILYMVIWYLGPLNKVPGLDFIGSHSNGYPQFFIPFSMALMAVTIIGRFLQLRN